MQITFRIYLHRNVLLDNLFCYHTRGVNKSFLNKEELSSINFAKKWVEKRGKEVKIFNEKV